VNRTEWFEPKWRWLKRFSFVALAGIAALLVGATADLIVLLVLGGLLLIPLVFWVAFIPILHWKERYIGGNSTIWGAFLVFETSSWAKLFYWFIHVLPDAKRSGPYADSP
jgi:hypothetical protein